MAATETIEALAVAPGDSNSNITSAAYTIALPAAAVPTFSPAAGTFTSAQNVTISDATAGATIYYTTNGTAPSTSSTVYSSAIAVSATTTIEAIAVASGYATSGVASGTFTINLPSAATPSFSPAAGTYSSTQTVTISDTTPGSTIYYTTNGATPTTASTVYSAPISVSSSETVNAIATATGYIASAVGTAAYTISSSVAAPVVSPNGGSYTSAQSVTLTDSTPGSTIYYTLDGSTPTTSSAIYTTAVTISAAGKTTLSALAAYSGLTNSAITTATFNLTYPANFQPTYSYKNVQIVGGGFVDGLYFHPKQQGLMYAHTDIGGAYRWNAVAGGDTQWVPLMDFIGSFNSGFDLGVQSLAIDPNDTTKLYLAVGDYTESYGHNGAVLASTNMGNSFTATQLPIKLGGNDNGREDGDRLVVDPNNGQHLYLGTLLNGLYESTNGSASWNQVTAFPITGVNPNNAEDPESGVIFEQFIASSGTAGNGRTKTVYYGVSSPTVGLYVSQDGGVTFSTVPGQPTGYYPNAEAFDATNNILYITYALNSGCTQTTNASCDNAGPSGPNAGQVWKYALPTTSTPNGVWTQITPPQTTPSGGAYAWDSVVVDPNHPNVIMVTTLNKYYPSPDDDVFRSADSGNTWYNIGTNIVRDVSLSPWATFGNVNANGTPATSPGNWLNHLVVDPFNSNHVMYGNGQTIWETNNIQSADGVATSTTVTVHGNQTNWTIGALGVEETDVIQLVSPTSGPAELFSMVGDLGGFTHTNLNASPASGMQENPRFSNGSSIDFAANNPQIVARVGYGSTGTTTGAYSSDGGQTWTAFATQPAGTSNGGGTIAVSADGSTLAWKTADAGTTVSYSTNQGATWTASTVPAGSQNANIHVYSDRVNAKKFYLWDSTDNNGATPVYVSTNGGLTFTLASTPANYDTGFMVSPYAEGDLWLFGYNGLYHSTNSGTSMTQVSGIDYGYGLGFGAAAPGYTYPAIYFTGHATADTVCNPNTTTPFTQQSQCIYRSVDGGKTYVLINNYSHQYGSFNVLTGDPRVFGRVYFGTGGRGIIEADSPN